MANIIITKTGKIINVDFGNYAISDSVDGKEASYLVSDISIVWLEKDESIVRVKMKDAITTNDWSLSYEPNENGFIVDLIDGQAPISNKDLKDKINALRQ